MSPPVYEESPGNVLRPHQPSQLDDSDFEIVERPDTAPRQSESAGARNEDDHDASWISLSPWMDEVRSHLSQPLEIRC